MPPLPVPDATAAAAAGGGPTDSDRETEPDRGMDAVRLSSLGVAPPHVDAESAAALAALPPRNKIRTMDEFIVSLRSMTPFEANNEELTLGGAFRLSERSFGSTDGNVRTLMVCQPTHASTPGPAIYFVHGGGMVSGSPRTGLLELLKVAEPLQATVVAVDYRLAPEHRDPLARQDTLEGLRAIVEMADELDIDPFRIAMVGSSAGGALAASCALMARDTGGPTVAGVMLLNPMLDDRNDSVSSHQMDGIDQWDRDANEFGWHAALGDIAGTIDDDVVTPYSAPGRATDLAGLPAMFVDVGSAETLRDECVAFANAIWQAGGIAELHVWPGGFHGYEFVAPHSRLAQETWEIRYRWLRRVLAE